MASIVGKIHFDLETIVWSWRVKHLSKRTHKLFNFHRFVSNFLWTFPTVFGRLNLLNLNLVLFPTSFGSFQLYSLNLKLSNLYLSNLNFSNLYLSNYFLRFKMIPFYTNLDHYHIRGNLLMLCHVMTDCIASWKRAL